MPIQSHRQPDQSFFSNLLNRARRAVSRWHEIRRLDPREVEEVARDLNISPAELVTLMLTPADSLEQLNKRLAYEGLSDEALAVSDADVLRDLRRVCTQCSSKTRCARDLRHKRMATPSRYCPNELTLRLLADEARNQHAAQVPSLPAKLS